MAPSLLRTCLEPAYVYISGAISDHLILVYIVYALEPDTAYGFALAEPRSEVYMRDVA